ncbi:GNAT family N-acetyltransferase [Anaerorhabdus sp.]|uniref:GNAT family N-acetyltransferase n=1 Tax=Anaerorhabdus sp. TaxID=1872524 RepID=UPI002FC81446
MRYLVREDIPSVLEMMLLVKDDFAGYKEEEFLEAVHHAIENQEAIIEQRESRCAGLIIFSKDNQELLFLAIHPTYRRQGISKQLINQCFTHFNEDEEIHVITFREGDPKGKAARNCYFSCGFVEAENLIVFDYPCQKLIKRI